MRNMLALTLCAVLSAQASSQPLSSFAMSSCFEAHAPAPIWKVIREAKPEAFLFVGDNIYFDGRSTSGDFKKEYAKMLENADFKALYESIPFFTIWDDHDYGLNDAGEEYPRKVEAQLAFNEIWRVPANSRRRSGEGIYDAQIMGPEGKRVQLIMLDTRYFRSPLKRMEGQQRGYVPDPDPNKTLLGAAQWQWLGEQLKKPAELRLIMTSIQVVSEDHRFEKWMNLPLERDKLFTMIKDSQANGVIFISGDRHLGELSMMDGGIGYPVYDLTASAINRSRANWRMQEVNRWRVGTVNYGNNFGWIQVDWNQPDPEVRLQLRDEVGDILLQQKLKLSWLKPGTIRPPSASN